MSQQERDQQSTISVGERTTYLNGRQRRTCITSYIRAVGWDHIRSHNRLWRPFGPCDSSEPMNYQ